MAAKYLISYTVPVDCYPLPYLVLLLLIVVDNGRVHSLPWQPGRGAHLGRASRASFRTSGPQVPRTPNHVSVVAGKMLHLPQWASLPTWPCLLTLEVGSPGREG